jgi:hypothetical protein
MTEFGSTNAREIMWHRVLDGFSIEQARLDQTAFGPSLSGSVMMAEEGAPLRVEYRIACDAEWRTRAVEVRQDWRGESRLLQLDHDGNGNWRRDGGEAPALAGCTDVDLGVTPSTNALPINRLHLPVGGKAEIKAAWLLFPEFDILAAPQSYERLAEARYRYTSVDSGFTAVLTVDPDGLPIDYENIWQRVAEGPASRGSAPLFSSALISLGPSPELGAAAEDFGWLVGGWTAEVRDIDADGTERHSEGEWWFAWTLEGRAIQDVWIAPPRGRRSIRPAAPGAADNRYGTTIRWFDRQAGQWRIVWVNPVTGVTSALAGRRDGDRITLFGEQQGERFRWSFVDIRPDSFIWRGDTQDSQGEWQLGAEFRLRRIA